MSDLHLRRRILGIDLGRARIGVAVSDELGMLAHPVETIPATADAARRIAEEVRAGRLEPAAVDEAVFARRLLTNGIPDPDLLIRTSGEKRISNFLLWQCAYAELVFLDRLWPDFTRDDLEYAIREYHGRDRRYGAAR